MPVSSNSLFHFTNSAEHLFSILRKNFIPRYCPEVIKFGENIIECAVPAVCFCDIPLSQIKNHLDVYGFYGIGLYKSWASENGINPVIYLEKKSNLSQNIDSIFSDLAMIKGEREDKAMGALVQTLCHLKAYSGDFVKNGTKHPDYKFYDEREWRFVPSEATVLVKDEYQNNVIKHKYNMAIENNKLIYHPDEISYLIIKDSNELMPMVESLKDIKEKYNREQVEKLITKIITSEQIMDDF